MLVAGVCGSGVCMLSCGVTRADRRRDLELVLGNQSVSAVAGDSALCPPCKQADTADTGHGGDIQNGEVLVLYIYLYFSNAAILMSRFYVSDQH